jgi:multisubunit Na+/H+ antiporter MnhB subunit
MDNRRYFGPGGWVLRVLLAAALAIVAAGLGLALTAPAGDPGLAAEVRAALPASGAGNPVTAVLLNFRGYDTLLEMAVLTAALAGVWSLGRAHRTRFIRPSPVLTALTRVLAPLFPLVCGYLLWAGADHPGGAFQAGAVLATAAVLHVLSAPERGPRLPELPLRLAAVAGLAVFLAVALGVMTGGARFLEYPPALVKWLMLAIETAAMLSIAAILAGLFLGGRPGRPDE